MLNISNLSLHKSDLWIQECCALCNNKRDRLCIAVTFASIQSVVYSDRCFYSTMTYCWQYKAVCKAQDGNDDRLGYPLWTSSKFFLCWNSSTVARKTDFSLSLWSAFCLSPGCVCLYFIPRILFRSKKHFITDSRLI